MVSRPDLSESKWQRARRDTRASFGSIRFWVADLVFFATAGVTATLLVPAEWRTLFLYGIPVAAAVSASLSLLGLTFVFSLVAAPSRQRNELRGYVAAQEQPDAIDELIDTLSRHTMAGFGQLDEFITTNGYMLLNSGRGFTASTLYSLMGPLDARIAETMPSRFIDEMQLLGIIDMGTRLDELNTLYKVTDLGRKLLAKMLRGYS